MKFLNKECALTAIILCSISVAEARVIDRLQAKESQNYSELNDSQVRRDVDLRSFQHAFVKSESTDNVTDFNWLPNETFKVNMRLHIKTLIYLPNDEKITAYTLGDNNGFKVMPIQGLSNMISVQSLYAGTDTNLAIIGKTGRIYNFYLRSYAVESKILPDFTIYVKAPSIGKSYQYDYKMNVDGSKKSKQDLVLAKLIDSNDYLKTLSDPKEVNLSYKLYGEKDISPFAVYDDGNWTFFDFTSEGFVSGRLPVIYKVVDGFDVVVNTRIENGFIIAESLSPEGWTLKNGEKIVCVRPKKDLKKLYGRRKDDS
ncbi:MAG: TrbG/VirB9 family P-type conjugative transfer protein [Rickettsiales bacterium]|jgi:type IV secretory pathway VirB9-like protein|nr:TrbG/VirB9 family P-type conjugative transfer protein [Rickettsiales bacterium]